MQDIRSADNGDNTYTNPILYCDYSDPDAIRVGDDFYMTASSFTDTPGLPLLHSRDLVNWEVINYCIDNVPEESYSKPRYGCGVWAPSIRYHEGVYYVVFPMPDEGIYVTKTRDPYGKWSEPVNIFPGAGRIDPCPFWDDDGRCYLVYGVAKSRIGFNNKLFVCELSPDCMSVIGESREVYDGEPLGHRTTEGPKLYKRMGYYYIFAPAGGVKPGYQLAMRAKDIYGPYDVRVVLKQGGTDINGPHQGAWVDTASGEDWFIHFRDVYAAGRITYLEPMKWVNDWPVIGEEILDEKGDPTGCGQPVTTYRKPETDTSHKEVAVKVPETSDTFTSGKLNSAWQWNCNHKENMTYAPKDAKGIALRCAKREDDIYANEAGLLMQKWPAPEFDIETELDVTGLKEGDRAGFVCFGLSFAGAVITKKGKHFVLESTLGYIDFSKAGPVYGMKKKEEQSIKDPSSVRFKLSIRRDGVKPGGELEYAPKKKGTFYIQNKGKWDKLFEFEPLQGRWTGAKTGVFADSATPENGGSLVMRSFLYDFL